MYETKAHELDLSKITVPKFAVPYFPIANLRGHGFGLSDCVKAESMTKSGSVNRVLIVEL